MNAIRRFPRSIEGFRDEACWKRLAVTELQTWFGQREQTLRRSEQPVHHAHPDVPPEIVMLIWPRFSWTGSFAAGDTIRRPDAHGGLGHRLRRCDLHQPEIPDRYDEKSYTEIMKRVYEG